YVDDDDLPDDVKQYYDQYKLRDGDFDQGSLDDVYDDAQAESDERGYSAGLTQDDIDQNSSTLDGQQAPQMGVRGNVETSDDVFELARPALKVFENFIPVNDKVPGDSLGRYGKITMEDVTKRFEEQLGISFVKFIDDADRLRTAHLKLNELNTSSQAELTNLYKSWTGPAANASYQHYAEKISPNVTDLLDYLNESPGMVETAVQNVFAECKAKADTVMGLYQPTVGSATPDIAMKVVELANSADDRDKIMEVAAWVDSVCGSNIENTIRDDDCGLNDENKEYVQRECKKWIRDSFNQDLHEYIYATFKQTCDDTLEAVDSYYEQLNQYLGEYENKFEQAGATTPPGTGTQPPGTPPGTGTTPPPSTPGGSSPGGTTPSGSMPPVSTPPSTPGSSGPGSSGPGSGGPGSPVPQMPEIPTPGSSTSPAGTSPSGSPGSGIPGSPGSGIPGSGTPGSTPGMPVIPGLPGASGPGSGVPGNGLGTPGTPGSGIPGMPGTSAPKEVTVQDGDRKITVGQPDAEGRSKVTVDDGKGEPREYTVDFTPEPGEQPEDGVIQAKDGKAVIQDGDAAISLEQVPGPTDRLKMTVDDGTPETYDMDFGPDSKVPGVPDVPGSPHAGLPDTPTPSSAAGHVGAGGGGGSVGGAGSFGGADTPGTSAGPQPGSMSGAGSPDTTGAERAAATSGAGAGPAGGQQSGQQGAFGGMPMGGMGAGGQGGDQSRQSKWRTTGQLFDDVDPAANFSGVVGRDPSDAPKPVPKPMPKPAPKR
ncbi:MAG TPA: hypothetical protein VGP26_17505, partial [Actinophytocola sp.]|nr:hypothetical protein [Actinophytocola sp.]